MGIHRGLCEFPDNTRGSMLFLTVLGSDHKEYLTSIARKEVTKRS